MPILPRFLTATFALLIATVLTACGASDASSNQAVAVPSDTPAAAGEQLAARQCFSCHSIDGSVRTGPTWQGLWGSEVTLEDGTTRIVDIEYITESIRTPQAARSQETGVMPAFDLDDDAIEDIAAYMQFVAEQQ